MTNLTNAAVIQQLYTAVNVKDFSYIKSLGNDKSEWQDITFNYTAKGETSVIQPWINRFNMFPDATFEIKNLIALDNYVIVQGIESGTHSRIKTHASMVPAEDVKVQVSFCDIYYLEGGKILKSNSNFDYCSFLRQLS